MSESARESASSSDLIDLVRELVAIDSVNPSLVAGGAGEGEIAAFLVEWAGGEGLQAEALDGTAGRPSVIVRARGRGNGRTLLLCGHLDTVGGAEAPRIVGNRLYGRGAYDMKAGVAAALIACRDAGRAGLAGDVVVAAVADEEHASLGVQEALAGLRADAAIVTEPTELAVAIAHKGFVWAEIETAGVAAHGSRPSLGVDAIVKSGPILVALGRLDEELREREHPLLGAGSVHASLIEGGQDLATYPDRCLLALERRTLPGETAGEVESELTALLSACGKADPALEAELRMGLEREPFEITAEAEIVVGVRDVAAEVLGVAPEVGGVSYWADSAFVAAAGIPTVLFGPVGAGAHGAGEWVDLPSTAACAQILTRVAARFCG